MSVTRQPIEDKQAYTILLECKYAPILDWFNYCPMCEHPVKKG